MAQPVEAADVAPVVTAPAPVNRSEAAPDDEAAPVVTAAAAVISPNGMTAPGWIWPYGALPYIELKITAGLL